MRLNQYEVNSIKKVAERVFGEQSKVLLFGSRVDDTVRGGDIDLYIQPESKDNLNKKRIRFIVDLESLIGEQKIDVVLARDPERLIEQEALTKGIQL